MRRPSAGPRALTRFTLALLVLYSCFTHALLVILRRYVAPFCCAACPYGLAMLVDSQVLDLLVLLLVQKYALLRSSTNVRILMQLYVTRARMPWCMLVDSQLRTVLTYADVC